MPRVACALLTIALVVALLADATRADARSRAPQLTGVRCVPSSAVGCRAGVKVKIGAQVQLRGTRLVTGMRVTFRWPRGALATRLKRSKVGWVARVPAGTGLGPVNVTVRDRARRRSRAVKIGVLPAPVPRNRPLLSRGPLPAAFSGTGMWIWYMTRSEGGDPFAIAARARAAGVSTVFVKSSDGVDDWDQFEPGLVSLLHAQGLRVCAWQFVYGNDPEGEARLGAAAAADGADCLVIDAETRYEGKYAQAQRYVATLRSIVGAGYPVGLTSFPYVDYHGRFPYSVFLGPGGAQANLPQIYWKDIGGTVDAVSAHTLAVNRVYGVPIAPLGQTSGGVPRGRRAALPGRLVRLRRGRPVVVELAGDARGDVEHAGDRSRPARRGDRSRVADARQGREGRPRRLAAAAPRVRGPERPGGRVARHPDRHGAAQLPARARHPADRHDRRRDVGRRPGAADGREGLDGAVKPALEFFPTGEEGCVMLETRYLPAD